MIIGTWNSRCQNWVYVVLSRVNILNGLLLTNIMNNNLVKFRISDGLLKEEKRLDNLNKTFEEDIKWGQKRFVLVLMNSIIMA